MERTLFITEVITKDNTPDFLNAIKYFEKEDSTAPIKVYINCYGGSVMALFSILDMLGNCKCPIYTINMGEADSAAALILAAGTKRFCTKNSMVMLHEMQIKSVISGNASDVESWAKEIKNLNDRIFTELSRLTKKSIDDLKKDLSGKELHLNAEEAIAYGVCDEIITTEIADKYQLKKEMPSKSILTGQKTKQGEDKMTKDELLTALQKDFDIDVTALKDENTELKKSVEILQKVKDEQEKQLTTLKKEKADQVEALENSKKEAILTKAVSEMKVVPAEKESFMTLFKGKSSEEMEKFVAGLTVKLHKGADGSDKNPDKKDFPDSVLSCIRDGRFTEEEWEKYGKKYSQEAK